MYNVFMEIDVDIRKENDIDGFDVESMVSLIKSSSSYDEFRIKCDIQDIECIITRKEFKAIKPLYGMTDEFDATFDVM